MLAMTEQILALQTQRNGIRYKWNYYCLPPRFRAVFILPLILRLMTIVSCCPIAVLLYNCMVPVKTTGCVSVAPLDATMHQWSQAWIQPNWISSLLDLLLRRHDPCRQVEWILRQGLSLRGNPCQSPAHKTEWYRHYKSSKLSMVNPAPPSFERERRRERWIISQILAKNL